METTTVPVEDMEVGREGGAVAGYLKTFDRYWEAAGV